jgi:hypothetical protein
MKSNNPRKGNEKKEATKVLSVALASYGNNPRNGGSQRVWEDTGIKQNRNLRRNRSLNSKVEK